LARSKKRNREIMTPKEKAIELVDKILESLYDNNSLSFRRILYGKSKQCALIAVDEILEVLGEEGVYMYADLKFEKYWQEVKQEIEKL